MKITKTIGTACLLVLGSLSFTFCNNPTPKENTDAIVVSDSAATEVVATNELTFLSEQGTPITISSLKGKAVFINFWATWCGPCIQEMPSINRLKEAFKGNDDIVFLMVDVDNEIASSSAFMKEKGYDLPVFVTVDDIPSTYLGNAIPTTVLLNKNGEIVTRMEGSRDYDTPEMIAMLKELIKDK